MKWNAFSTLALAFLTTSVLAQQAPGELRTERSLGRAEGPGKFHEGDGFTGETETSHLKALVEAQKKKIYLLEEKIKRLEADLQKAQGVPP